MIEGFTTSRRKTGIACFASVSLLLTRGISGTEAPQAFDALLAVLVVGFCGTDIHRDGLGGFYRTQALRPSLLQSLGILGALIQSLLLWILSAPRPGFEIPVFATTALLVGNLATDWVLSKLKSFNQSGPGQLPSIAQKWGVLCDSISPWFLPSALIITGLLGITQFITTGYAPKALTAMVALLLGLTPRSLTWAVRSLELALSGLRIPPENEAQISQEVLDQARFNVGLGILGNLGILAACSLRFVTPVWAAVSHQLLFLFCLLGAWKLRRDLEAEFKIKSDL
jgi:cation transport ATPase